MRYHPQSIEKKWQKRWQKNGVYEPDFLNAKKPFYNLMMFPYPSAEGLHIGSVRTFTGVDIYGRFQRMRGYDVFEPMGLDGFGIHSENYALKVWKHPMEHARDSEKNFYRQLASIGNGFAWKEHLETYDPEYYQWTQWIFVQMFKRGLAYRKKAAVNWCPSCKTVLSDEQVAGGVCERCGTKAEKKDLEQWFFKITDYAERLLGNLEKIDWSENIKIAQKNWIGKSEGAEIEFKIKNQESGIKVFTTRPDTLFGTTYMALGPEHPLIANCKLQIANREEVEEYVKKAKAKSDAERIAEGKEKTGVELKGVKAINPANQEDIPIFVADYVLGNVGMGAIMAVPAHDQRDFEFAKKYNLPIKMVVCPHYPAPTCPVLDSAYEGDGHLVDSGKFNGTPSEQAKWEITKFVGGARKIQYRLRDWLISRQRYWGPPIPMVYCKKCEWQPVPEKDLPVKLPHIKDFRPTGTSESPLASVEKFYKVRCPKCHVWARRETDVSDTFLDSAWYYLRYPSVKNKKHPWDPVITKKWFPVDMYIGGAEHAVLHLLYVRFLAMVLHDMGFLHFEEPFKKFRSHGLITKDGAKMSKSRGNVVNPDEYIRAYGIDAVRMYLAFLAPLDRGGDFRDEGIRGATRFLERVWKFVEQKIVSPEEERASDVAGKTQNAEYKNLERAIHRTIKKVTEDIGNLQYNTAISALMVLLKEFEEKPKRILLPDIKIFLRLLAPFAPFIAEELYQSVGFGGENKFRSIHIEKWPEYDEKFIKEGTFDLIIQINGKMRGRVILPVGTTEAEAKKAALAIPAVRQHIQGDPRKVIFVPDRLINFVV